MRNIGSHQAYYPPELARVTDSKKNSTHVILDLEKKDRKPLDHQPGQFVQVSVFGHGEVPISICSSPGSSGKFQLCVRPVGNVTRAVHNLSPGDWVGIRGPYGRGFRVNPWKNKDLLVVAGGMGLAPLRSLVQFVRQNRNHYGRLVVAYGAKNPTLVLFRRELEAWQKDSGMEVFLTVDEPDEHWKWQTGVVTDLIRDIKVDPEKTIAVVVGPPIMYPFVARQCLDNRINPNRIYFSLERHFKCGIGKCGHCQLDDVLVCRDGPLFSYSRLLKYSEAVEVRASEKDEN